MEQSDSCHAFRLSTDDNSLSASSVMQLWKGDRGLEWPVYSDPHKQRQQDEACFCSTPTPALCIDNRLICDSKEKTAAYPYEPLLHARPVRQQLALVRVQGLSPLLADPSKQGRYLRETWPTFEFIPMRKATARAALTLEPLEVSRMKRTGRAELSLLVRLFTLGWTHSEKAKQADFPQLTRR